MLPACCLAGRPAGVCATTSVGRPLCSESVGGTVLVRKRYAHRFTWLESSNFGRAVFLLSAALSFPMSKTATLKALVRWSVAFSDIRECPQTSANLRKPPRASAYLRKPPRTSADLRKPPRTSARSLSPRCKSPPFLTCLSARAVRPFVRVASGLPCASQSQLRFPGAPLLRKSVTSATDG